MHADVIWHPLTRLRKPRLKRAVADCTGGQRADGIRNATPKPFGCCHGARRRVRAFSCHARPFLPVPTSGSTHTLPDEAASLQARGAVACSVTTTIQRGAEELQASQPLRWLFGPMATQLQVSVRDAQREITWYTPASARVQHTGTLTYREPPYRRGTKVRVSLVYHLPGGRLMALLLALHADHPGRRLQEALRKFKQCMEAGEIAKASHGGALYEGCLLVRQTRCARRTVPDPKLLNPRDAIVQVTSTAICGSDLHLYDGYLPTLQPGDIFGHEFMGEVVETGAAIKHLRPGDRVVVPFAIACGHCYYCRHDAWSLCDNSNPNAALAEKLFGFSPAGLFGCSHAMGGYAGGQAEFVRVPFADVGPLRVPHSVPEEKVLLLSDILPSAWMAAENCNPKPGDVVAVWGCGSVGLLAIKCAYVLGAEQVIAIDHEPDRLRLAKECCGAMPVNFSEIDVYEALVNLTGGRGPDSCIDAVGLEAHRVGLDAALDPMRTFAHGPSGHPHVLRQAIRCCRKGGTISIAGVYVGFLDKIPLGAAFAKGLTIKTRWVKHTYTNTCSHYSKEFSTTNSMPGSSSRIVLLSMKRLPPTQCFRGTMGTAPRWSCMKRQHFDFAGKSVLITGGSRGLGLALARARHGPT